ncbi:hypothetical protein QUF63_12080 [Anaerolineales bacterium HSG25]|nr:hypothetical protein [Anaerolineales bacterium HSG25]
MILVACQATPALPDIDYSASRHFPDTGYTVQGEFLHFFEQYGGEESLGQPISSEMLVDGWTMQYFEHGRLERHPENDARYRITVGWLGEVLHRRQPPLPPSHIPSNADKARHYFPQTGHTISGDFWDYFQAHGDTVRFGLPISEPFLLEGQLTQDFQSARFFWTPEADQRVMLEDIGRVHLEMILNTHSGM